MTDLTTFNLHKTSSIAANDSEISGTSYERYQRRLEGLQLIRDAITLLSLIQQHRASSLAVLGGTDSFRPRTYSLQRDINETVAKIHQTSPLLDRQRYRCILTEWFSIKGHWHRDAPLDNFEMHNYLIEQVTLLIQDIAVRAELATDSKRGTLLSEFAFKHLIKHIETLGMLRGLSTYIASSGECQRSYMMRLSHLRQVCDESTERHKQTLKGLPNDLEKELKTQYSVPQNLRFTDDYLQLINNHMLNLKQINIDSDEVFYFATRAIEAELRLLEKMMSMLQETAKAERQHC